MINLTILCASRPRLIKQTLETIGDLSNATVTIRDAGMNAEVFEVVNKWAIDHSGDKVAYSLCIDPTGTGTARNEVVAYSEKAFGRGTHLYISDDDCYFLRPDWLNILVTAYQKAWDSGFRVLGAYNHPYHHPIEEDGVVCVPPDDQYFVFSVHSLASQSMLMSWDVWDEFGPFCATEAGKVCQSEDVDFCNRIRAAGYKVGVVAPALLVNCGVTNSFGEKIPGYDLVVAQAPAGVVIE